MQISGEREAREQRQTIPPNQIVVSSSWLVLDGESEKDVIRLDPEEFSRNLNDIRFYLSRIIFSPLGGRWFQKFTTI